MSSPAELSGVDVTASSWGGPSRESGLCISNPSITAADSASSSYGNVSQQVPRAKQLGFISPIANPSWRSSATSGLWNSVPSSPAGQQQPGQYSRSPSLGAANQAAQNPSSGSSSPVGSYRPALHKCASHSSSSCSISSFKAANRSSSSLSHSAAAAAAATSSVGTGPSSPRPSVNSPRIAGVTWHKAASFSPSHGAHNSPRGSLKHIQVSTIQNSRGLTSPKPSMSPGQRLLFTDDVELTPPVLLLGSPGAGAAAFSPQALAAMLRSEAPAPSGSPFAAAAGAHSIGSPVRSPSKRHTTGSVPYFQRASSSTASAPAPLSSSPFHSVFRAGLSSSPGGTTAGSVGSSCSIMAAAGAGLLGKRRATADCVFDKWHTQKSDPTNQQVVGGMRSSNKGSTGSSRRSSHQQSLQDPGVRRRSVDVLFASSGATGSTPKQQKPPHDGQHARHTSSSSAQQHDNSASPPTVHFAVADSPETEQHSKLRQGTPHPAKRSSDRRHSTEQQHSQQQEAGGACFMLPHDVRQQGHQQQPPPPDSTARMTESPSATDLISQQQPQQQQRRSNNSNSCSASGPKLGPEKPVVTGVRFDVSEQLMDAVERDHVFKRKGTPFPGSEDRRLGGEQQQQQQPVTVRFLVADPLPEAAAVVSRRQSSSSGSAKQHYARKGTPYPGKLDELTARPPPDAAVSVSFAVSEGAGPGEVFKQHSFTRKGTPFPGRLDSMTDDQPTVGVRFTVTAGKGAGEVSHKHSFTRKGTPFPGRLDSLTDGQPVVGVRFSVADGQGAGEESREHSFTRKGTPFPGRLDSMTDEQQTPSVRFSGVAGSGPAEDAADHSYARKDTPFSGRLDSLTDDQAIKFLDTESLGSGHLDGITGLQPSATGSSTAAAHRKLEGHEPVRVRFSIADGTNAGETDADQHRFTRQPTPFVRDEDAPSQQQQQQFVRVRFSIRQGKGAGEFETHHKVVRSPTPFIREDSSVRAGQQGSVWFSNTEGEGPGGRGVEHHVQSKPTTSVGREGRRIDHEQSTSTASVRFSITEGEGPGERLGEQHIDRKPTPFVGREDRNLGLDQPAASVRFSITEGDAPGERENEQHFERKPTPFVPREDKDLGYTSSTAGVRFADAQGDSSSPSSSQHADSHDSSRPSRPQHAARTRSSGSVHFSAGADHPARSPGSTATGIPGRDAVSAADDEGGSSTRMLTTYPDSTCSSKVYSCGGSSSAGASDYACDSPPHSVGSSRASSRGSSFITDNSPSPVRRTHSIASSGSGHSSRPARQQRHGDDDQQHYMRKDTPYPLGQGDDHSHDLKLELLQDELTEAAMAARQRSPGISPQSAISPNSMSNSNRFTRSSTGSSTGYKHIRSSLKQQPAEAASSRRSSGYSSGRSSGRSSFINNPKQDSMARLSVTPYIAVVHVPATGGIWDEANSGKISPLVLSTAVSAATSMLSPRSSGCLSAPSNSATSMLSPRSLPGPAGSLKIRHHHSSAPSNISDVPTLPSPGSVKPQAVQQRLSGSSGLQPVPELPVSSKYSGKSVRGSEGLQVSRTASNSAARSGGSWSHSSSIAATESTTKRNSGGSVGGSTSLLESPKGNHKHTGILAKAAHAAERLLHSSLSSSQSRSNSLPNSPKGSKTKSGKQSGKSLMHAFTWMHNRSSPSKELDAQPRFSSASGASSSSAPAGLRPKGSPTKNSKGEGASSGGQEGWTARVDRGGSGSRSAGSGSTRVKFVDAGADAATGSSDPAVASLAEDIAAAVDPAAVAFAELICSGDNVQRSRSRDSSFTVETSDSRHQGFF